MEVILMQDVPSLGARGAVVAVKDGHARNYLLPQGLAKPATSANRRLVDQLQRRADARAAAEVAQTQALADQLAAASCTIAAKVGDQDKLHGSITAADIAKTLTDQGIPVDKRQVELEEPLHQLGVYRVAVRLHPKILATVKVWIVKA